MLPTCDVIAVRYFHYAMFCDDELRHVFSAMLFPRDVLFVMYFPDTCRTTLLSSFPMSHRRPFDVLSHSLVTAPRRSRFLASDRLVCSRPTNLKPMVVRGNEMEPVPSNSHNESLNSDSMRTPLWTPLFRSDVFLKFLTSSSSCDAIRCDERRVQSSPVESTKTM